MSHFCLSDAASDYRKNVSRSCQVRYAVTSCANDRSTSSHIRAVVVLGRYLFHLEEKSGRKETGAFSPGVD